ncbi:MAG: DUF433 domain-containing protein [Sorangiineae bacterium]|nr:DUF433 domain-containing protein [Polyangiaceae bacterium]MEB2324681.1 DUF433 domain-containing protein [Sorangiineae bacterium]
MTLPMVLVPHPHVRVDSNVLGGSPYVAGSRVLVRRLFAFYRRGVPIEQLRKNFPQLRPAALFDALAFALDNPEVMDADLASEREILARLHRRAPGKPQGPEQIELPFARATGSGARG